MSPDRTPVAHFHGHSITVLQATRWLGIFVCLLAIVTVAQGIWITSRQSETTRRQAQVAKCQAKYNDAFARTLNVRARLQDSDREALDTFVLGLADAPDRAASRRIFAEYVARLRKTSRERVAHPLPTLDEKELCRDE